MVINITSQIFSYANFAAFPGTGAAKTLYIAQDTDIIYYWDGSQYVATGSASVAWGAITGTLSDQTDLQTALDGKVDENASITGATKTKITYDSKGLVTAGADATTADINDSTNRRYVTDAQLTVIGNTSGINTGDQTRAGLGIQSGQVIVTSGTSFTTPSNITTDTSWKITLVGAGGGGGGMNSSNQTASGGGGGGACIVYISGLTPSTTYTCAIGAGGAGGTPAGDGVAGGNTTLTIGATTYTAGGGAGGIGIQSRDGGVGGTATNGTLNFTGQQGGDSPVASGASTDGKGGDSALGYGIGGSQVRSGNNGRNGTGYGGGGSGSKSTATTGGNGSDGIIIGEYFN